ncbi:DUF2997 domain-containing protein [Gloeobacter violaceus]|nr:DUF2997 domain-containing protein [Gloeobacter violaceus]
MAEYQRIEYVIGKDGKITERVSGVEGGHCTEITAELEAALGRIERRESDGAPPLEGEVQRRLDQGHA